jgi:hypothetical protein
MKIWSLWHVEQVAFESHSGGRGCILQHCAKFSLTGSAIAATVKVRRIVRQTDAMIILREGRR